MVSSALVRASTFCLPISRRVAATSEISSRPIASKVGRIMNDSFFFPSFPSSMSPHALLRVLLVSSVSHLHSPSRLLLLRSRACESFSKAQGLELVLRETTTPRVSTCRLVRLSRQARGLAKFSNFRRGATPSSSQVSDQPSHSF